MKKNTILGADVSWVTQLEAEGWRWVDEAGAPVDPLLAAKNSGVNAIRLRVFVDPPAQAYWEKPDSTFFGHFMPGCTTMLGYCDKTSIVELARRGKALGLELMLDFHYSDHFADPVFQDIPAAWASDGPDAMIRRVTEHTEDVLRTLQAAGVSPDYVQVGNEINTGLLRPAGGIREAPEQMVRLLNAGYDTVRRCCPGATVVTHVSMGNVLPYVRGFFDVFFDLGGQTDMIGLSYYPHWCGERHKPTEFLQTLTQIEALYHKPLVLSEIGGRYDEPEESYSLLADTLRMLEQVPGKGCAGMFYWEPEAPAEALPDRYPLGAARLAGEKTIQYTKALSAYRDYTME